MAPDTGIRSLQGSTAPWPEQIEYACLTLRIDLKTLLDPQCVDSASATVDEDIGDPRIDWTFKWVLRSLESGSEGLNERSLHPESWYLLLALMQRSSVQRFASSLRDSKFVEIIHRTFIHMGDESASALEGYAGDDHDSTPEPERSSKKRKRAANDRQQRPYGGVDALFMSVCKVLSYINDIITNWSEKVGYAVEHLKHATKFPLQAMADILGHGFYIGNALLHCSSSLSQPKHSSKTSQPRNWAASDFDQYLQPLISTWHRSTSQFSDAKRSESNTAFLKTCAINGLLFLSTCMETHANDDFFRSTKELLIRHVTRPYRQKFVEAGGTGKSHELLSPKEFVKAIGQAIQKRRLTKRLPRLKPDKKTQNHKICGLLSLIFALGVESSPRHSSVQRQKEDSWLEALLSDLLQVLRHLFEAGFIQYDPRVEARLSKFLLEQCDTDKVTIRAEIIEDILKSSSGIFDVNNDRHIEWDLVGYCMSLDTDVFIVPKIKHSKDGAKRKKNEYLKALLSNIIENPPEDLPIRQNVIRYVVVGLLDGFSKARSLPMFLDIWTSQCKKAIKWRKQLKKVKDSQLQHYSSAWEDDLLMHESASRLQNLTPIQRADAIVALSQQLQDHWDLDSQMPQLLVLEAVMRSAKNDAESEAFSKCLAPLLHRLTVIVTSNKHQNMWRVWRLLSIVQQRRHDLNIPLGTDEDWRRLMDEVLYTLSQCENWPMYARAESVKPNSFMEVDGVDSLAGNTEAPVIFGNPSTTSEGILIDSNNRAVQYYAFTFLVTSVLLDSHEDFTDGLDKAVKIILSKVEAFCRGIQLDMFRTAPYQEDANKSFTPGSCIRSTESLYIGCISVIVSNLTLFGFLAAETQQNILSQISSLALWTFRVNKGKSQSASMVQIDSLWYKVLRTLRSCEDRSLHDRIVTHVCDRYAKAAQLGNPGHFEDFPPDYLFALQSVHQLSSSDLNHKQTQLIAHQVCQFLILYPHCTTMSLEWHLILLWKTLRVLPDPLEPILKAEALCAKVPSCGPRAVMFIEAARNLGMNEVGEISMDTAQVFRQLVRLTVRYLVQHADASDGLRTYREKWWQDIIQPFDPTAPAPMGRGAFKVIQGATLQECRNHMSAWPSSLSFTPQEVRFQKDKLMQDCQASIAWALQNTAQSQKTLRTADGRLRTCLNLDCLEKCADLLRANPKLMEPHGVYQGLIGLTRKLKTCEKHLPTDRTSGDPLICPPSIIATHIAILEMSLCDGDDGLITCLLAVSGMLDHGKWRTAAVESGELEYSFPLQFVEERTLLRCSMHEALSSLDWQQRGQLLTHVVKSEDKPLRQGELVLIRAIFLSDSKAIQDVAREALGDAFMWLCDQLISDKEIDAQDSLLCLQCLAAFLYRHPRLVTSRHIPSLLCAITLQSQRLQPHVGLESTPNLYTALTRVATTLLRTFRPRVARYHHILLTTLQSLLHNLFTPYPSDLMAFPATSSLTSTHATGYARLLTLLCDPTPSAAAPPSKYNNSKNSGLVDQVQRAKAITGEHMQYLLASYCEYQLEGKLQPGMKEALRPALWVVLDCVEQSTLRAMGASMRDAERSVFRALYGEYNRAKEAKGR